MFLTRGPLPLEAVWREWLLQARGMLPLYCVAAAACANAGWDEVRAVRAACQGGGESESGSSSSSSSSSMGSMGSSSMGSNPDDPHMILGQRLFRVYTHAPPSFTGYPRGSIFRGTLIEDRLSTTWGDHSMVEATRRLLRAALLDGAAGGGSNQKFMLLSESCAPMYHPAVVHQQLLHLLNPSFLNRLLRDFLILILRVLIQELSKKYYLDFQLIVEVFRIILRLLMSSVQF